MEVTPNTSIEGNVTPEVTQSAPQATTPNVETAQGSTPQMSPQGEQFAPDFKFKVMDKEFEIEEMYRPLIKDSESQKAVKRLFEKAYGLERVEASRNELKTKLQTLEPKVAEYEGLEKQWNYLSSLINEQDFGSFISEAQIDPKIVFKWVKDELRKLEMDPYQRQEMEQFEQYKRQSRLLQRENEQLKAQYGQNSMRSNLERVQSFVSHPEYSNFAQAYNEKMGDENAFTQAIIQEGAMAQMLGNTLTPEQAVAQVVDKLKKFGLGAMATPPPQAPQANSQAVLEQSKAIVDSNRKKVIPAVQANATSPLPQKPKTLAELKKYASNL